MKKMIEKKDIHFDKVETKEILSISVPSISGRLLANVGFFLEPIILNRVLLFTGSSLSYITREYGIYNAYAVSTLLFPSFIITAISNALLPEISKHYAERNSNLIKARVKQSLFISLVFGIICTLGIYFSSSFLLHILYNTNEGITYIKILAPFFILYYLEAPLSSILTGINKVKTSTVISTVGIVIKLCVMVILGLLHFKIYALVIAEIVDIVFVSGCNFWAVRSVLAKENS